MLRNKGPNVLKENERKQIKDKARNRKVAVGAFNAVLAPSKESVPSLNLDGLRG